MLAATAPPSHRANWSGLEGSPRLAFQLAALTAISLNVGPSHLSARVAPAEAPHGEVPPCMQIPDPDEFTYARRVPSEGRLLLHCLLLRFSLPAHTGFKRLRRYDKPHLPTELGVLSRQTQGEPILSVKSMLAACPASSCSLSGALKTIDCLVSTAKPVRSAKASLSCEQLQLPLL